ncbi:LOW QUALITY PROTEIN: phosphatidylinositol 4,5-bisphosphate 5-phosphatase A [Alosa alosa]|nr:LOW QUALITY PROTEIN: phosphatidylinositol 4,5-bisphosphate 5-phosphatase A [Alosa alosa]
MDPEQNQTQPDGAVLSAGPTEGSTSSPAPPESTAPVIDLPAAPLAPTRPRRPQRAAHVEGSIDVSESKSPVAPESAPAPAPAPAPASIPDDSPVPPLRPHRHPPCSGPSGGPLPHKPLLKGAVHQVGGRSPMAMRAASLPQAPSSKPPPRAAEAYGHAHRTMSVAGTADTQPQVVEDFRIHVITWNVGSAMPPDDITSLLGLNVGDGNTDMYIIGLQEVNSMINKRLKDVLFTDQWSEVFMDRLGPFGYVLVTSQRMQGVLLLVFAKYYHLPFLRGVQTETTRTGLGGIWGNKGGVSARMTVFGHSVCFLNCHLPAHMENSEQRMDDFESILQQQQFECQVAMGVLDHDVVFWFGDLNFRIDDLDMHVVKGAIDANKLAVLWEKDQLNMAKDSETVLEGFHEGPLKFPPTYKFDVGTNTYDTSGKKRKPAWTDRILWRLRATAPPVVGNSKRHSLSGLSSGLSSGTRVTQHFYRSHMEYTCSDHKPVASIFTLQFPYKVDIPLITLIVEDEWREVADAVVRFKVTPNFGRSSWDWIGLYKVGFKHHKDYVGYTWAKQEESDYLRKEHEVTFPEEELPKGSGDFILGYYSNNTSTIVGMTEPFQISLPTSSPGGVSPSDSSDFSSEDDGTVGGGSRPSSPDGATRRRSSSSSPSPSRGSASPSVKPKRKGRHGNKPKKAPDVPAPPSNVKSPAEDPVAGEPAAGEAGEAGSS